MTSNMKIAKYTIWSKYVVLVTLIVILIVAYFFIDFLYSIADGVEYSASAFADIDRLADILSMSHIVISIISFILFTIWFYKSYANLENVVDNLEHKKGWIIGAWFVPIVNLYKPYKIMQDMYLKAQGILNYKESYHKDSISTRVIAWWWALYLISAFSSKISDVILKDPQSMDTLFTGVYIGVASEIVAVAYVVLSIKLIKDYAKVEAVIVDMKIDEKLTIYGSSCNISNRKLQ